MATELTVQPPMGQEVGEGARSAEAEISPLMYLDSSETTAGPSSERTRVDIADHASDSVQPATSSTVGFRDPLRRVSNDSNRLRSSGDRASRGAIFFSPRNSLERRERAAVGSDQKSMGNAFADSTADASDDDEDGEEEEEGRKTGAIGVEEDRDAQPLTDTTHGSYQTLDGTKGSDGSTSHTVAGQRRSLSSPNLSKGKLTSGKRARSRSKSNGAVEMQTGAKYNSDHLGPEGDVDGDESGYTYGEGQGGDGYRNLNSTASMTAVERKEAYWRAAIINLLLIGCWYFFSTLISIYNKWMFTASKGKDGQARNNFPFPLFVTSFHMVIQFIISGSALLIFEKQLLPRRANGSRARPDFRAWATKIVPCALATGMDIGLSNLSLKTITLTFYTMCKSSNLAFVLFFAFLFGLERIRWSLIGIIAVITVGVVMMVAAETKFVLVGAVEVLTASAMGGLRWSLTQILLDRESLGMSNPVATIFYLAPVMAVSLLCASAALENWKEMAKRQAFDSIGHILKMVVLIAAPGFLAFCMSMSEFALIQRTSVVTLSVAGIFKEVMTIFVASTIFGDELTPINITGLCITIFGIALYNYLKYRLITHAASIDAAAEAQAGAGGASSGGGFGRSASGGSASRPLLAPPSRVASLAGSFTGASGTGTRGIYSQISGSSSTRRLVPPSSANGRGLRAGAADLAGGEDMGTARHHVLFDEDDGYGLSDDDDSDVERAHRSSRNSLAMSEREDLSHLSESEIVRRRKREEEANMDAWQYSGTRRTGDGYDEDSEEEE